MYKSLESGLGSITVLFRRQSWSADQTWGLKSVLFNCLISSIILYWVYTRAIQIYYQYILIIGLYPFVHLYSGICIHICILGQILYPSGHSQIRFCIHIFIPRLGSVSKYAFLVQALSINALQVMLCIHLYILRLYSVSIYIHPQVRLVSVSIYAFLGFVLYPYIHPQVRFCIHIYKLRLRSVSIYTFLGYVLYPYIYILRLGSVYIYATLGYVLCPYIHSQVMLCIHIYTSLGQVLYRYMQTQVTFCVHIYIIRLCSVFIYTFLGSVSIYAFLVLILYPYFYSCSISIVYIYSCSCSPVYILCAYSVSIYILCSYSVLFIRSSCSLFSVDLVVFLYICIRYCLKSLIHFLN